MKLRELIVEGYREVEAKFVAAGADPNVVKQSLDQFRDLVNRNQVKGNERNIDWWGKNSSYSEFDQFLKQKSIDTSKTQLKKSKEVGRSVTLMETDDWLVVVPLDKDASCFHGKSSDWCTTKRDHGYYEDYFYKNNIILIYCLNKKTGGMWAIANYRHIDIPEPDEEGEEPESEFELDTLEQNGWAELFDQRDQSLTHEQFKQQTGLDSYQLMDLSDTKMKPGEPIAQRLQDRSKQLQGARTQMSKNQLGQRNVELEKDLIDLGDEDAAYNYAEQMAGKGVDVGTLPLKLQFLAARITQKETILPWIVKPDPKIVKISSEKQRNGFAAAIDHNLADSKLIDSMPATRFTSDIINKLREKKLFTKELRDRLAADTYGISQLERAGVKVSLPEIEASIINRKQYTSGLIIYDLATFVKKYKMAPTPAMIDKAAELLEITPQAAAQQVIDRLQKDIDYADRNRAELESRQYELAHTVKRYKKEMADFEERIAELSALPNRSYSQDHELKKLQNNTKMYSSFLDDYRASLASVEEKINKAHTDVEDLTDLVDTIRK